MTGSPYGTSLGGPWQPPPNLGAPSANRSKGLALVALVVAVLALAAGIGSWLRPQAEAKPPQATPPNFAYSEEEVTADEKAMCEAYDKALRAVNGTLGSQSATDPTLALVMSVDTRFAFEMASKYFVQQLERHPATPPDLADNFRRLAEGYTEMLLLQLARAPQDELDEIYKKTDALDAAIIAACK